tara:strand:+ start:323 stop:568 length:246 start_codon:yes stop_codon:yes gene_type:complete
MIVDEDKITTYTVRALLNDTLEVAIELSSFYNEVKDKAQAQLKAVELLEEGMFAMPDDCWDNLTHLEMRIKSIRIINVEEI